MRFSFVIGLLIAVPAFAQAPDLVGRWATSQGQCPAEYLQFGRDGRFESTLDDEKREGTWRASRERVTLTDENEPDRPLTLHLLDFSGSRLVAFDETIEADRRLVRCR